MIKLQDISVSYGDNKIYEHFSFEFDKGVNVVLGSSGSGKTTLINVIASLVQYQGQCETDKVAVVFQTPALAPISALNNVAMVVKSGNTKQIAHDMLRLAQVEHLANMRATTLSGGEQQRVSLARAFATERPVLLLDEPFHSLDYGVKRKLYRTLSELLAQYGKTVVLVTHDIDEAVALGDRIYLLSGKPCTLTQVAEISTPQLERDDGSEQATVLRKQLQQLLL